MYITRFNTPTQPGSSVVARNGRQLSNHLKAERPPYHATVNTGQKSLTLFTALSEEMLADPAAKETAELAMAGYLEDVPGFDVEESTYQGTKVHRRWARKPDGG
jgi:hypothetical protein